MSDEIPEMAEHRAEVMTNQNALFPCRDPKYGQIRESFQRNLSSAHEINSILPANHSRNNRAAQVFIGQEPPNHELPESRRKRACSILSCTSRDGGWD